MSLSPCLRSNPVLSASGFLQWFHRSGWPLRHFNRASELSPQLIEEESSINLRYFTLIGSLSLSLSGFSFYLSVVMYT